MTDDETILDRLTGESTRRSVLKSGALATAGAGLAGATSGSGVAQEGDGEGDGVVGDQNWRKGIMAVTQFQPTARFIITSPVIEWSPNVEEIQDNLWSEYNTRVVRYLNSNEQVLFWQAQDAQVPEFNQQAGYVVDAEGDTFQEGRPQPEIFRMRAESSPLGASGYVTVNFAPVGEDEENQFFDDEGDVFFEDDNEDEGAVGPGDDVLDPADSTTPAGNQTENQTNGG